MNFEDMSAGDIVATVYSRFEPRTVWDADRLAGLNTDEPPRLYCPSCRAHGTLVERSKRDDGTGTEWHCRSCKAVSARPAILQRKGGISATSTRGGRDNDWSIVDGIIAGKVMSAVESLPMPARSWTLWVYTDHTLSGHQSVVLDHVIANLDSMESKAKLLGESYKIIQLILLLSDNVREQARNGNPLHSLNFIAQSIGIPASEIKGSSRERKWTRIRGQIEDVFDGLDSDMAAAVMTAVATRINTPSVAC